jgi:hypothetical protein
MPGVIDALIALQMRAPQLIFLRSGAGRSRPQRHSRLFEDAGAALVRRRGERLAFQDWPL